MNRRNFLKIFSIGLAASLATRAANARVCQRSGMDYVIETWTSGTNWFRRYRSGWVEQGGLALQVLNTTVTLHITMRNNNYYVGLTHYEDSATTSVNGAHRLRAKTASTIRIDSIHAFHAPVLWEVKGMAA